MSRSSVLRAPIALVSLAAACFASPALAQTSLYGGVGITGVVLGVGHSLGDAFGVRGELSGWPPLSRSFAEDGIEYRGELKLRRATALADWRPFGGTFRLSAGLSAVNGSGDFTGNPQSAGSITIGQATVAVGPEDRYSARIELPSAMPYVGLGWGHSPARGLGFFADLGVLVGEPKVSGALSSSLRAKIATTGRDPDVELQRELQSVRDGVANVFGLPVVNVGLTYRW